MKYRLFFYLLIFLILPWPACQTEDNNAKINENNTLIIFHAGSLSLPMKQIAEAFKKENPAVEILLEAAGSVKSARKISDLNKPCDIMASADYSVIDELLIPDYADWNIKFASNELSIVYNDHSRFSDEINNLNWPDILLKKEVIFGRSDPDSDPCGYRTLMMLQLAENYYHRSDLMKRFTSKDLNYIRPKETDLLALLESNAVDYIFLYKSVAIQHNLKYLSLSDSINLKSLKLNNYYKNASVNIKGKKPGETVSISGSAMAYGITIPKNAPNPQLALKFLEFMLDKNKGMKIMEENGQPSTVPAYSETYNAIPDKLKKYATNKKAD